MSSPVMACARTSCQIAALGEREVHAGAELRAVTVSIHPPEHRIKSQLQRKSERFPITAQADRGGEAYGREHQPDPQTRTAQESPWSDLGYPNEMGIDHVAIRHPEVESLGSESDEAPYQHGPEIRCVESNPLDQRDRQRREDRPQKCGAPRPG